MILVPMKYMLTGMIMGVAMAISAAGAFRLTSPQLEEGGRVANDQIYNGFGYKGPNLSPVLNWPGAPAGTKSFALTMYDPDAPHPGGWWHWMVVNIPGGVSGLPEGVKPGNGLPEGAVQIENDFGMVDYGGPAPPPGAPHRYIFTIYALKVDHLSVSPRMKPVAVKKLIEQEAIASATLTGKFGKTH